MIRTYTPADLEQVVHLFIRTVHTISCSYYSPEEVEAWAPSEPDMEAWADFFDIRYTLVMDSDGTITGFGCLNDDGNTIDMLFTHHAHQGEGIGSSILDALEKEVLRCGNTQVQLTTSATAWPFYQKHGYQYYYSKKEVYTTMIFDCQVLCKALPVFRPIRRRDRVLENHQAEHLLQTGKYGFLSVCGANGYGYGIPMNYVWDGNRIYFHCAPKGFKLDSLRQNPRVSFCVVGHTQIVPQQFSAVYESAHVFGRIVCDLREEERHQALRLIVAKYSADFTDVADKYIRQSFYRTHVLRLDIEHLSGKVKK